MINVISGYALGDLLRYGILVLSNSRGTALLIISTVLLCIAGYLIGGINTSILYSRAKYKVDIRESGSGNAGLTNMLRTYGKGAAAVTLAGDILKTAVCCLLGAVVLGKTGAFFCGYAAVIGHIWPVWFKFRGGKGVLSLATVMLCCEPRAFLIGITIFFITVGELLLSQKKSGACFEAIMSAGIHIVMPNFSWMSRSALVLRLWRIMLSDLLISVLLRVSNNRGAKASMLSRSSAIDGVLMCTTV